MGKLYSLQRLGLAAKQKPGSLILLESSSETLQMKINFLEKLITNILQMCSRRKRTYSFMVPSLLLLDCILRGKTRWRILFVYQ